MIPILLRVFTNIRQTNDIYVIPFTLLYTRTKKVVSSFVFIAVKHYIEYNLVNG